jgi:hypothetical protein
MSKLSKDFDRDFPESEFQSNPLYSKFARSLDSTGLYRTLILVGLGDPEPLELPLTFGELDRPFGMTQGSVPGGIQW